MRARYQNLKEQLSSFGQDHLLSFYDELDETEKAQLLEELEAQDWETLNELIAEPSDHELPSRIEPAPAYPRQPSPELEAKYEKAKALGEDLIRAGKIAAFTVAGGQGTRLGWDGPKGTFPATPISGKSLFQLFAETIRKAEQKYGVKVPWYLMTSELNDGATRAFFIEHAYFGLNKDDVMLFKQGSMPSISKEGKVLLASKSSLALNPDGHGGSLKALYKSGALKDMRSRGVEHISYFQVDNPNVKPLDPLFIGLHALDGAEMSAKMLRKVDPFERVGVFCLLDDKLGVIEYSDLPETLAAQRDGEGKLVFDAGSIAIHLLSADFVERLNKADGRFALPYHRAHKKVSYLDVKSGKKVTPDAPNAIKLETFVFDALPLARKTVILETERTEEFAPVKNAEGADSPATSQRLQSERAARWLEERGVKIPRDEKGQVAAIIELSPLMALAPEDLKSGDLPEQIPRGARLAL